MWCVLLSCVRIVLSVAYRLSVTPNLTGSRAKQISEKKAFLAHVSFHQNIVDELSPLFATTNSLQLKHTISYFFFVVF